MHYVPGLGRIAVNKSRQYSCFQRTYILKKKKQTMHKCVIKGNKAKRKIKLGKGKE